MAIKKKLVVLSGPSCVGKGPLRKALRRYHPEIKYAELVLCNSRPPRLKKETNSYEINGKDYYFLPRGLFAQLDESRFIIGKVRTDLQAIDADQVRELLETNNLVLAEVSCTLGRALMKWVNEQPSLDFEIKTVAIVPLSNQEIEGRAKKEGKSPKQILCEVMKGKLEKRDEDSPAEIEERASAAFEEVETMRSYTHHIVNHAGEDDGKAWSDPLEPEAQRVLDEFVAILNNSQVI